MSCAYKGCKLPLPQVVPYHKLMSYMKSIEIGKLYDVGGGMLCDGMDENEKVNGCYEEILILKLAEFYPNSDQYNILTFDEPNTFHTRCPKKMPPTKLWSRLLGKLKKYRYYRYFFTLYKIA